MWRFKTPSDPEERVEIRRLCTADSKELCALFPIRIQLQTHPQTHPFIRGSISLSARQSDHRVSPAARASHPRVQARPPLRGRSHPLGAVHRHARPHHTAQAAHLHVGRSDDLLRLPRAPQREPEAESGRGALNAAAPPSILAYLFGSAPSAALRSLRRSRIFPVAPAPPSAWEKNHYDILSLNSPDTHLLSGIAVIPMLFLPYCCL
ncbi:hypothetical protein B0H11DRAFT_1969452 [Mycena galericulata]|nr:hypothetical protein B0H11DRAFT_1969452 [Mycena galericulata]